MKIYTRTGDAGFTGLVGGDRVAKTSLRIAAIGDVDELNAAIGVAVAHGLGSDQEAECRAIQNRLFDIGSDLASPNGYRTGAPQVDDADIESLELSIDSLTDQLEVLREFILPGGAAGSAALHQARCVCRRAERSVLALSQEELVRSEILKFLNRLSDWLFVAARTDNARNNVSDVAWIKKEHD